MNCKVKKTNKTTELTLAGNLVQLRSLLRKPLESSDWMESVASLWSVPTETACCYPPPSLVFQPKANPSPERLLISKTITPPSRRLLSTVAGISLSVFSILILAAHWGMSRSTWTTDPTPRF